MPSITPIRLEKSGVSGAAGTLTEAFRGDPLYIRICPDLDDRTRSLGFLWRAVIDYCLVYGEVTTTRELSGAACWLSPGNTDFTFMRLLRTGFRLQRAVMRFRPEPRKRILAVLDHTDKIHRQVMASPHWYLMALGVAPDHRGAGIGGTLIEPVLARADAAGVPCYLETQTERNVSFYERRGFRTVHEGEAPGLGVTLWAMAREPG